MVDGLHTIRLFGLLSPLWVNWLLIPGEMEFTGIFFDGVIVGIDHLRKERRALGTISTLRVCDQPGYGSTWKQESTPLMSDAIE